MQFVRNLNDPVYDSEGNITTINKLYEYGLISFEKWTNEESNRNTYVAVFKGTSTGWRINYRSWLNKVK